MGGRRRGILAVATGALAVALLALWLLRPAPLGEGTRIRTTEPPPPRLPGTDEVAPETPTAAPEPVPARTSVTVIDAVEGSPLRDGMLEATFDAGSGVRWTESGPGAWTLEGGAGTPVTLRAWAAGHGPVTRVLTVGCMDSLVVALAEVHPLEVRVLDSVTSGTVEGALVRVTGGGRDFPAAVVGADRATAIPAGSDWRPAAAEAVTDGDGVAMTRPAETAARRRVDVFAPGRASTPVAVSPEERVVHVLLEPAVEMRVEVVDGAGDPVEGASVRALSPEGDGLLPGDLVPRTDEAGFASVTCESAFRPEEAGPVLVTAPGWSPQILVRAPGETGPRRVVLTPRKEAGVRLLARDGRPAPGLPVRFLPLLWRTPPGAPEETVALSLSTGRATMAFATRGAPYLVLAGTVEGAPLATLVAGGAELEEVPDLDVPAAERVTVAVRSREGRPVAGARVVVGGASSWSPPAGEGTVPPPGLPTGPDGSASMAVAASTVRSVAAFHGPTLWTRSDLPPAAEALDLRLRASGRLRVRVVNPDGEPLPAALVRVRPDGTEALPEGTAAWLRQEAVAGPAGEVEFEVPAGMALTVDALSGSRGAAAAVTVESGARAEVELVLAEESGRLFWLRVLDPAGEPVPRAIVHAHFAGVDPRGPFVTDAAGVIALRVPDLPVETPMLLEASGPAQGVRRGRVNELADGYTITARRPGAMRVDIVVRFRGGKRETEVPFRWSLAEAPQIRLPSRRTTVRPLRILAGGALDGDGRASVSVQAHEPPLLFLHPAGSPVIDCSDERPDRSSGKDGTVAVTYEVDLDVKYLEVRNADGVPRSLVLHYAATKGEDRVGRPAWIGPRLLPGETSRVLFSDGDLRRDRIVLHPDDPRRTRELDSWIRMGRTLLLTAEGPMVEEK